MAIRRWISGLFGGAPPSAKAFDEDFWSELMGHPTASGMPVSWRSALENPTALRAVMLIADGVSTVPCKLMRKERETGKRYEAVDHPVYDLLRHQPCGWMTSQQFRETMMLRALFTGQSFAFVNRLSRGRISEIWPFDHGEVSVEKPGGQQRAPIYRVNGEVVPADRLLHLRGPSWDGYKGMDMVSLASEVMGLADAAQEAHAKRFGNGVQSTGLFSVEGALDDAKHKRLSAWIAKHYAGRGNSGKPLLLDLAAKFIPFTMSGVDAEHLATRTHQDLLTARFWGVLPIMVGITDKTATYASAEQMFLAHCVHTIRPWHVRVGEVLDCALLTPEERRQGYYIHFVDTALLRGAAKDRAEFYARLFNVGGLSPNQILNFEDMDGFEGGDTHFVPANSARILPDGRLEGVNAGGAPGQGN